MLKRWIIAIGLIGLIVFAVVNLMPKGKYQAAINTGDIAKDFQLPDLQGKLHSLPKGEVVLVNFWATWCPPCQQEIPSMEKMAALLQQEGLKVLAVSVDIDGQAVQRFVREKHMQMPVLHDQDQTVSHDYGVYRYPETFLIDRQGRIRMHQIGAIDWMQDKVLKSIRQVLSEQP